MYETSTVAMRQRIDVRRIAIEIGCIIAGSVVVALGAQVALPLPFTPIPVTLQTLAVLLVGVGLGWKRGSAAILLYLAEGAAGLPVFAGGAGGLVYMQGATAGYLLGFVPAAALAGWLAQRGWCRTLSGSAAVMTLGTTVILGCGVLWLGYMRLLGLEAAIALGLIPFIPGAIAKIAAGAAGAPLATRLLARLGAVAGMDRDSTE